MVAEDQVNPLVSRLSAFLSSSSHNCQFLIDFQEVLRSSLKLFVPAN